jgi:bacteriorhodopsin
MIALGYPGEVSGVENTKWLYWALAMVPFLYILFTLNGELKAAKARETGAVSQSITNATVILLVTWLVYPIAYLIPVVFTVSDGAEAGRQIAYTIADITAKGLYGLMILSIAKARSGDSH